MSDGEVFVRLLYYGTVHLNRTEEETWLLPIGELLDLWECHKQFLGLSKPAKIYTLDDFIP